MKKVKKNNDYSLEDIEKMIKPKISLLIACTLICLGPYGHLILKIVDKDYEKLLTPALLTFPTLIAMCTYWYLYLNKRKSYKSVAKEVYENIKNN